MNYRNLSPETGAEWDFSGERLDWCRLQAYMSVARAATPIKVRLC